MTEARYCVLIPVYNHWQRLAGLVSDVRALELPVYLVDDGSDEPCRTQLQELGRRENVCLITLAVNSGKGVAVAAGLRRAYADGFSHAVQIDADGQHLARHMPDFLSASQAAPAAVVSGQRPYHQMSPGRARGRKLTDFWVCINTLSRSIRDSMCGYRLYPLAETCQLLDVHAVGRRMDFDTDMIVRLYWSGLSVRHVTIDVVYDADIPSHFHMLFDNARMVLMHTRHFFGMLVRMPFLVGRNR